MSSLSVSSAPALSPPALLLLGRGRHGRVIQYTGHLSYTQYVRMSVYKCVNVYIVQSNNVNLSHKVVIQRKMWVGWLVLTLNFIILISHIKYKSA